MLWFTLATLGQKSGAISYRLNKNSLVAMSGNECQNGETSYATTLSAISKVALIKK